MIRMAKHIILAALMFAMPCLCRAEGSETVRLVTDRDVYVAGDMILCSASCWSDGFVSDRSAIAYVELVSAEGVAATAKIALVSGRGAGYVNIPADAPTGNYRIFAYTALSESAETRNLAIYNTFYGNRVLNGVIAVPEDLPLDPSGGDTVPDGISCTRSDEGGLTRFTLSNNGSGEAFMSVSVFVDDGLKASAAKPESVSLTPREAENDGETIRARVYGPDAAKVTGRPWLTAVISSPGSAADTYTGKIRSEGDIIFKTNNIYGERDLVCEILGLESEKLDCHFSPISPFIQPEGLSFPPLLLSASCKDALQARHESVIRDAKQLDTLFSYLPKRDNLLLDTDDCESLHLDDYERFNTIEDIILELVPKLAVRKVNGKKTIKMMVANLSAYSRSDNVLVLLDGVPVSDHERLLEYDALALSDIQVYPYYYALGKTVFTGVVNFITARHDMSALKFADNVRILDFQGCSYPVALRPSPEVRGAASGDTILWEPLVRLAPGASVTFSVPSGSGCTALRATSL